MDINALLHSLNIEPTAIPVNIVGFLILLAIANNMVFKPINKVLEERQQDVRVTYDKLEAEQQQMQQLRSDYEQRLASIEAEAREKIQSAVKEAQATRDQIVAEAQTRSREMITRAEQEVTREKEQALIAIREQVVNLALGAAHKVIGDNLDDKRQRSLIAEFINAGTAPNAPVRANGAAAPATPATPAAEA
jgi:F-type H+-transporting ATPase subunit b